MKYDKYVSLIRDLEVSAASDRRGYERKVFGMALLGYGYFILLILAFLVVPIALLALAFIDPGRVLTLLLWTAKFWWAAIPVGAFYFGFLGSAVKSLFAKVPEPEGTVLRREDAPELFSFIDSTCETLDAVKPREVFLTDEFNASVVTLPRLGLFGSKVYLRLGLPVMKALSPEQFKAVLAHEIGHISGKHGGFGKWTYQLHDSWGRFIELQELNENRFSALYQKFVEWFFPYFQAYSFVLMREHEKEADEYSAKIVGSQPLAEALIALQTRASILDNEFWPAIDKENQEVAKPTGDIFSRMLGAVSMVNPDRDAVSLERAIRIPTDYNDSHPCVADRIKTLGYWNGDGPPKLPAAVERTAADHFLAERLTDYVNTFEADWKAQADATWKIRYDHFQKTRKRVEELESKTSSESLTVEELLEKASLIAEREGNASAIPILLQALELDPRHAEANYALGGVLLSQDDEIGLEHLRLSMSIDDQWKYAASDVAFGYLRMHGRLDEAREFAAVLDSQQEDFQNAQKERASVTSNDHFSIHSYNQETVEKIIQKIRYHDEIRSMYLVRKEVQYFKEVPYNVLFIEMRNRPLLGRTDDLTSSELLENVAERLEPFEIGYYCILDKALQPLKEKVAAVPGSQIFVRE